MAEEKLTVISRQEARVAGLKRYSTGELCKKGHQCERRVSTGCCLRCEYENLKAWRSANPEAWLEQDRKWKRENGDRRRASERARYSRSPEKSRLKNLARYQKNSERLRKKRREYHYAVCNDPEFKKRAIRRTKKWAESNPDKARISARAIRARRKNAPGSHTAEDIIDIHKMQRGKCACCKRRLNRKYHVDHIVAIAKGGSNARSNLQILCPPCNLSKHDRDPIDHMQSLGFLL